MFGFGKCEVCGKVKRLKNKTCKTCVNDSFNKWEHNPINRDESRDDSDLLIGAMIGSSILGQEDNHVSSEKNEDLFQGGSSGGGGASGSFESESESCSSSCCCDSSDSCSSSSSDSSSSCGGDSD